MIEKLKNIGWTGAGLLFAVLAILLIVFLVRGGVGFIENHQDLIDSINQIIIGVILLLLVLSVIPRLRMFTGLGIVYATSVWIFLLWLNCLGITYELWGLVGMFVGVIMFGLGIFATAPLALLFDGQWSVALTLLLTLAIMYGVRMLGNWIASKHKDTNTQQSSDTNAVTVKQ